MLQPAVSRKQEEVFQACNNLHTRAERITNESIAQELVRLGYRRGSNSDLTRYKKLWQEQFTALVDAKAALPQRTDKLETALDEMRAEIRREAALELEQYKADVAGEKKQWQETLSYAQQEMDAVRQKIMLATQQEHDLQTALKKALSIQESLLQQLAADKQQQLELQSVAEKNITALTLEKAGMENELAALRHAQVEFQTLAKNERSELMEKMEAQRHQAMADLEHLKGTLLRLEKDLVKTATQQQALQAQNQDLKNQIQQFDHAVDQLQTAQRASTQTTLGQITTLIQNEYRALHDLPLRIETTQHTTVEKLQALANNQQQQLAILLTLTQLLPPADEIHDASL